MRLSPKHRIERGARPAEFWPDEVGVCFTSRGMVEVRRLGRGEPIVVVPGLAGGSSLLEPLVTTLAQTHEVILYALSGDPGTRPGVRHQSISEYALDLAELMTSLRLERPTVLGVSFGGAVALQLAVDRPGLTGELILSGVSASFPAGLASRVALHMLESYPLPSTSPFINQFFNLLHGGKPRPQDDPKFVVNRIWETDQGVMASRLRALTEFDVSDRLWNIDCPCLIAAGSRDVIVPPANQRELARSIPGARSEVLQDAGHIAFLTHHADFGRLVHRALRQRERATF